MSVAGMAATGRLLRILETGVYEAPDSFDNLAESIDVATTCMVITLLTPVEHALLRRWIVDARRLLAHDHETAPAPRAG